MDLFNQIASDEANDNTILEAKINAAKEKLLMTEQKELAKSLLEDIDQDEFDFDDEEVELTPEDELDFGEAEVNMDVDITSEQHEAAETDAADLDDDFWSEFEGEME